jgi:hypothetical protein
MKPRPHFPDRRNKSIQMSHGAGRQVVKNYQRPGLRPALIDRSIKPSVRIFPVARDGIPQHACVSTAPEVIDDAGAEQAVVQISSAAERAKQPIGVDHAADQVLRPSDLARRHVGFAAAPEGNRMAKGMIADPMTLRVSPLANRAAARVFELFPDDEERAFEAMAGEDVENRGRDLGFRAVVEGEGNIEHERIRWLTLGRLAANAVHRPLNDRPMTILALQCQLWQYPA